MSYDILVVDDQEDIRQQLSGILSDEGYKVRSVGNSHEALEALRLRLPSIVLLDIWLNDHRFDGIELLDIVRQEHPEIPVVMISGHGNIETAVSALKKGAIDFIEKPFKIDRLLSVITKGIEAGRLRREISEYRAKSTYPTKIDGPSSKISNLRQTVKKVARTNSRVLIEGAAGSGKEVVARLIHQDSLRSEHPFVVLNCAALQPEDFEKEFFGQEISGGSPEIGIRLGALERAHGGTLFLKGIWDMPLETQGKLLKVLQGGEFHRVGGTRKIEVDIRIISSIGDHNDLLKRIEQGSFREDLYYRLNVVPIVVPSLSERREDIQELANVFLDKLASEHGIPGCRFSEEAMLVLQSYEWPGNIRQLRNTVEWVLIMLPPENRKIITSEMLPQELLRESNSPISSQDGDILQINKCLKEAREAFERHYLMTHMRRYNGNITRTAKAVGMERTALHRKLKLLNIRVKDPDTV